MTTRNLDGIDDFQDAATRMADEVRRRAEEVARQRQQGRQDYTQRVRDAEIAMRVLRERYREQAGALDEEHGQMAYFLNGGMPPGTWGPAPQPPAPPARRNHVNPTCWGTLAWLLALLGVAVGLVISAFTYGPLWSQTTGTGHDVLVVIWFIALVALFFFFGGWIGSLIEERRRANRRQH